MTDLADGSELQVVPWRRFGHDRLYVNAPDGTRIGWLDRKTGESTLEVEEFRADFERALAKEASPPADPTSSPADATPVPEPAVTLEAPTPTVTPATEPEPTPEPAAILDPEPMPVPELPWTDLALNQPGEAVAAEAKRAFDDAPVRSLVARALQVHTTERAWRVGAKGEVKVGKQLAKLDPAWRTLHSVPVGKKGSDIDHVVIGPGGVYTVNAKHHPNKSVWVSRDSFIVDGFRHPYVRNARYEAKRAERTLSDALGYPIPVIGLIAVVGAHEGFTVKEQPRDGRVLVLGRKEIVEWLGRRGPVLDSSQVDAIFEVARRSTTWT